MLLRQLVVSSTKSHLLINFSCRYPIYSKCVLNIDCNHLCCIANAAKLGSAFYLFLFKEFFLEPCSLDGETKWNKEEENAEKEDEDSNVPPVDPYARDETVINLHQWAPIYGVLYIDLLAVPPQPITTNGWIMKQGSKIRSHFND